LSIGEPYHLFRHLQERVWHNKWKE